MPLEKKPKLNSCALHRTILEYLKTYQSRAVGLALRSSLIGQLLAVGQCERVRLAADSLAYQLTAFGGQVVKRLMRIV